MVGLDLSKLSKNNTKTIDFPMFPFFGPIQPAHMRSEAILEGTLCSFAPSKRCSTNQYFFHIPALFCGSRQGHFRVMSGALEGHFRVMSSTLQVYQGHVGAPQGVPGQPRAPGGAPVHFRGAPGVPGCARKFCGRPGGESLGRPRGDGQSAVWLCLATRVSWIRATA